MAQPQPRASVGRVALGAECLPGAPEDEPQLEAVVEWAYEVLEATPCHQVSVSHLSLCEQLLGEVPKEGRKVRPATTPDTS